MIYLLKIISAFGFLSSIIAIELRIDGLIDLGPNWNYEYRILSKPDDAESTDNQHDDKNKYPELENPADVKQLREDDERLFEIKEQHKKEVEDLIKKYDLSELILKDNKQIDIKELNTFKLKEKFNDFNLKDKFDLSDMKDKFKDFQLKDNIDKLPLKDKLDELNLKDKFDTSDIKDKFNEFFEKDKLDKLPLKDKLEKIQLKDKFDELGLKESFSDIKEKFNEFQLKDKIDKFPLKDKLDEFNLKDQFGASNIKDKVNKFHKLDKIPLNDKSDEYHLAEKFAELNPKDKLTEEVQNKDKPLETPKLSLSSEHKLISSEQKQISSEQKLMSPDPQALIEEKQLSAENKQISDENKQMSDENKQISAEIKQMSAEDKQVSAENKEISAEHKLISAEQKVESAEQQHKSAEEEELVSSKHKQENLEHKHKHSKQKHKKSKDKHKHPKYDDTSSENKHKSPQRNHKKSKHKHTTPRHKEDSTEYKEKSNEYKDKSLEYKPHKKNKHHHKKHKRIKYPGTAPMPEFKAVDISYSSEKSFDSSESKRDTMFNFHEFTTEKPLKYSLDIGRSRHKKKEESKETNSESNHHKEGHKNEKHKEFDFHIKSDNKLPFGNLFATTNLTAATKVTTSISTKSTMTKVTTVRTADIYSNPHKVKDDVKLNEFTNHIFKQTLKAFDTIKKRINQYNIKKEVDVLARSYEDKFRGFLKDTRHQKIKTRLGTQKVVLNSIDESNRIVKRLYNYMMRSMDKKGILRNNLPSVTLFHKEMEKQQELELAHACKMFGICRKENGFPQFLIDILTINLKSDDTKFRQSFDAFTEIVKAGDYESILDEHTEKKLKSTIEKLEFLTTASLKPIFMIMKNIIINKNKPLVVGNSPPGRLNATLAFFEIIDLLDQYLPRNTTNILEWNDIKNKFQEFADDKRFDILEIQDSFINHIKKGVISMSKNDKTIISKNLDVLLG